MDATHLKVWLPFDESATLDRCGNSWTAYNSPTVSGTNAIIGNALQLANGSYVMCNNLTIGGQDFTIHGYCYMSSSSGKWARIFEAPQTDAKDTNILFLSKYEGSTNWALTVNGTRANFAGTFDQLIHFEVDYQHDTATTKCFINGELKATLANQTIARVARKIRLGKSSWDADGAFIGSIDEFMIHDGVALHTENFTPPTAADYDAITSWGVTATADVEVLIANRDPASGYWRYENPGSGDYVLYHDNITTENVDFDQSVTGVAFWGGDRKDMVGIPAGCKELWIRLDLWVHSRLEGINSDTDFGFGCMTTNPDLSLAGYRIWSWTTPTEVGHTLCINKTMYFTLRTGSRNSILVYLKSGKTDGEIRGTVGSSTRRYTGNVNSGDDFGNVFFWSTTNSGMFSNIVVSNAPLSLEDGWHREPAAVEFNIKAVDLCVRKNGRTYVIPFSTTSNLPVNSVVARVGGKTVYNPLVATADENASALKVRCNGEDRALSAAFN